MVIKLSPHGKQFTPHGSKLLPAGNNLSHTFVNNSWNCFHREWSTSVVDCVDMDSSNPGKDDGLTK